jgi:hypothetical protein
MEALQRDRDARAQRGRAPLTIRSYRSLCEQDVYPRSVASGSVGSRV